MEQFYKNAMDEYLNEVANIYTKGNATEHSYRGILENLIEELYKDLNVTNEPKHSECGAPDYIVSCKDIQIGYIEAKDIGKDLESKEFDEQFNRYKSALDNLVITDYIHFKLFKNSELVLSAKIAEVEIDSNKVIPVASEFEQFKQLFDSFRSFKGLSITSASNLVEIMADKSRLLADVILKSLNSSDETEDNKSLNNQLEAFRQNLIHDISKEEFSDMYAQTIAYGIFLGYLYSNKLNNYTLREASISIPKSNPFLRHLFSNISAEYNVSDSIKWIVEDLTYIFNYVNKEEVLKGFGQTTAAKDPLIHFYETFLSKYNPQIRDLRGVYYTPKPIVRFVVNAVNDILKDDFNLKGGLANITTTEIKDKYQKVEKIVHKVQILDPATGTGTFLSEVIRQIYNENKNMAGVWKEYIDKHLLPRVHGFEILMGALCCSTFKFRYGFKRDRM